MYLGGRLNKPLLALSYQQQIRFRANSPKRRKRALSIVFFFFAILIWWTQRNFASEPARERQHDTPKLSLWSGFRFRPQVVDLDSRVQATGGSALTTAKELLQQRHATRNIEAASQVIRQVTTKYRW